MWIHCTKLSPHLIPLKDAKSSPLCGFQFRMTACTKVGWWEEEVGREGKGWQIWATRIDWRIGGVDSAERHSLVCFQTLMRFWQEKRPYPLLSYCHSSDAGPPLGSQSGLQQPSHCHVTVFKANLNMALMVFPHSFWENSMRWGLWWLMNYPFITFLTFRTRHWSCGSCVLTNKCSCLSGAVRDFQLQPREKSKGNMDYITSLFFFFYFGFSSSFFKRVQEKRQLYMCLQFMCTYDVAIRFFALATK